MDFSRESAMTFDNEMFAEVLNVSDSKLFMTEFKDRVRSILIMELDIGEIMKEKVRNFK